MENLETQRSWSPEDDVSFDGTELVEVLQEANADAAAAGERFPYLLVRLPDGGLADVVKVALVRGDQSDGSQNYEIVLTLGPNL